MKTIKELINNLWVFTVEYVLAVAAVLVMFSLLFGAFSFFSYLLKN